MFSLKKEIKILLVEDDFEDYKIFKYYLDSIKDTSFVLDRVYKYSESLKWMLKREHDIYILDYYLGEKNGIDLFKECIKDGFSLPVIFLTGKQNTESDLNALKYGAYDYLLKENINSEILERSIRYALSRYSLEKRLKDKTIVLESIIKSSPVGICVTMEDMSIVYWNDCFIQMFGFSKSDMKKKITDILKFNRKKYDIYSYGYESTSSPFLVSITNKIFDFEGKLTGKKDPSYCVVRHINASIKNGKDRIYRIFSFIEVEKHKEREKKLINAVNEAQKIVVKYANQNKDSKAYMDLAGLEMLKMSS